MSFFIDNVSLAVRKRDQQSSVAYLSYRHQRSTNFRDLESRLYGVGRLSARLEIEARLPLVGYPSPIPHDKVLPCPAPWGLFKHTSGHILGRAHVVGAATVESHIKLDVDPFLKSGEHLAVGE